MGEFLTDQQRSATYISTMSFSGSRLFPSKILLFGEYGLMYGSKALSIPYDRFHGSFGFASMENNNLESQQSNHLLKNFLAFLNKNFSGDDFIELDLNRFEKDLDEGLSFDSNIPQGYGLGSSGALVANLISTYGNIEPNQEIGEMDLPGLKAFFGRLESYFHGKSSGLDPLISFLNKPLLIESATNIRSPQLPVFPAEAKGAIFLVDSGSMGETQPLVDFFVEACKKKEFLDKINNKFIPLTNDCISAYLKAETNNLLSKLNSLSAFQLDNFERMIPTSIVDIWKNGLETGIYSLKLCGSGGGGMMLGFTSDFEKCQTGLKPFKISVVHRI